MNTNRLPPLNSLKAFDAAARHESFLEAAAEQDVTPGSVSRHVRLLERYLGTELFVRRSNGVTLTSAGKEYAGKVSGILRDLRTATDRVRKPSGDRAIVISTLPIFSERWLYRRVPSFRKAFDRAELRIEVHNGEHDAEREDVDAWIMCSKGQHPDYSVTRLFGEEVLPVCSPQFRETLSSPPRRRRRHRATPAARHLLGHRLAGLGADRRRNGRRACRQHALCALQRRHPGGGRRHGDGCRPWRDGRQGAGDRQARPARASLGRFREILSPGHDRLVGERPDPRSLEGVASARMRSRQAVERLTVPEVACAKVRFALNARKQATVRFRRAGLPPWVYLPCM